VRELRAAGLPPPCARKPFSRNRSRSDQLPQGDSGRPHAAGRSYSGLVFATGSGAGHHERLPEPAGRDLERLAIRHHSALTEAQGLDLRRPPSETSCRYFFLQVDVTALFAAISDWTIAQIPGGAAGLAQLVCDGKTLRCSIVPTAGGGSAYQYFSRHHIFHLAQKLLPPGAFFGSGLLVITVSESLSAALTELLSAHEPSPYLRLQG
jgi:hypothetical protein